MAWTAPLTFASGETLTASQLNLMLRDNMNGTMVAQARLPGYVAGNQTAANTIHLATPITAYIDGERTVRQSLEDIGEYERIGPSVTISDKDVIGVLYWLDARLSVDSPGARLHVGVTALGEGRAGQFSDASTLHTTNASGLFRSGIVSMTTAAPGTLTVMAYMRSINAVGRIAQRRLTVLPYRYA